MILTLLVLHGGDGHIDLVYFWSAVVMASLPVAVFIVIGFLVVRAYIRRQGADGGDDAEPHPQQLRR
jgi:hypothetical protein